MSEYIYKGINVKEIPGGLELAGVSDFVPSHTFECGQCFRWRRVDEESYDGVAAGRHARVSMLRDGRIELLGASAGDLADLWYGYLDLDTDYSRIKASVAVDDIMRRACTYGGGIRLLRQDFWETAVSFIISANNNIPRISGSVERICDAWGDAVEGTDRRAFPSPERLATVCAADIRACGVGFRDRYIAAAAEEMSGTSAGPADGESCVCSDVSALGSFRSRLASAGSVREAERVLTEMKGIGPKVADCILLFSGLRFDVFPKDVWVFRAMRELYPECGSTSAEIDGFARDMFGGLTGYAQQYLFYWARANL